MLLAARRSACYTVSTTCSSQGSCRATLEIADNGVCQRWGQATPRTASRLTILPGLQASRAAVKMHTDNMKQRRCQPPAGLDSLALNNALHHFQVKHAGAESLGYKASWVLLAGRNQCCACKEKYRCNTCFRMRLVFEKAHHQQFSEAN